MNASFINFAIYNECSLHQVFSFQWMLSSSSLLFSMNAPFIKFALFNECSLDQFAIFNEWSLDQFALLMNGPFNKFALFNKCSLNLLSWTFYPCLIFWWPHKHWIECYRSTLQVEEVSRSHCWLYWNTWNIIFKNECFVHFWFLQIISVIICLHSQCCMISSFTYLYIYISILTTNLFWLTSEMT